MVVGTLNCSILVGTLKPRSGVRQGVRQGARQGARQGTSETSSKTGDKTGSETGARQVLYNGSVFFCRFCRIFGGSLESP